MKNPAVRNGLLLLAIFGGCAHTPPAQLETSAPYQYRVELACDATATAESGSMLEITLPSKKISSPRSGAEAIGHALLPGHKVYTLSHEVLLSTSGLFWQRVSEHSTQTCRPVSVADAQDIISQFARYLE